MQNSAARILFVDDEEGVREAYCEALSLEGYAVDMAADGNEAFSMMKEKTYDAVIADIRMPGLDGVGLYLKTLSTLPVLGNRFIFISSADSVKEDAAFRVIQDKYFLLKPFEILQLTEKIRMVIKNRERFQKLAEMQSIKRSEQRFAWCGDCVVTDAGLPVISIADVSKNGARIKYHGGLFEPDSRLRIIIKGLNVRGTANVVWSRHLNQEENLSGIRFSSPLSTSAMLSIFMGKSHS